MKTPAGETLRRALPPPAYRAGRAVYHPIRRTAFRTWDAIQSLRPGRPALLPPRALLRMSARQFTGVGESFKRHLVELGGLTPADRVLDVGCGVGTMAMPLADWLESGSYEGLDVITPSIEWCQREVTPRFPTGRFQVADVYNREYNPDGTQQAAKYRFPYEDESFDLAFMSSLYTHMLYDDVANYVRETARVLRPGGRCVSTYFLLNPESIELLDAGEARLDLRFTQTDEAGRSYRVTDPENPEYAVALHESAVREFHDAAGLEITGGVHYGAWCGRSDFRDFQDIVVAAKLG